MALGAIGIGLVGYGLWTALAPASAPMAEGGTVGVSATQGELGAQTTGAAANAVRARQAMEAGQAGGSAVSSAVVAQIGPEGGEPNPGSVTPGEARAESFSGRQATTFLPIISAMLELTPPLYFAKTGAEREEGVPLPFTSAEQADALGQLAWEAVAALVPYHGITDVAALRELGLLKSFVLYANPAVIAVYRTSPEALPEIGALRDIDGFQYVVVANYIGL